MSKYRDHLPDIKCIAQELFNVLSNNHTSIMIFENNTIVLLDDNSDFNDILEKFHNINFSQLTTIKLHFFNDFTIILYVNPNFGDACLFKIVKNSSTYVNMTECINNFKKDYKERKVIFDSKLNKIDAFKTTMYFIVNNELKMDKGKIGAQIGHATGKLIENLVLNNLNKCNNQEFVDWSQSGVTKIVLKSTKSNMDKVIEDQKNSKNFVTVVDAGKTQIEANSLTVIGFNPMYKKDVPQFISELSLL